MSSEKYRIMFVFRTSRQLDFLIVCGMDFNKGAIFTVLLYSRDDHIQLDYGTSHYPKELMKVLSEEKERIDSGFYDIRTWQMATWDKDLVERRIFKNI